MQVESARFGQLEVADHRILTFPRGLFAFEDCRSFALIEKGSLPLQWLQALDCPELTFVVIDPRLPFPGYRPLVTASELATLQLTAIEEAALLSIVTVPTDPRDMTANLQAPLIINARTMRAVQLISSDPDHQLCQPLLAAVRAKAGQKTG